MQKKYILLILCLILLDAFTKYFATQYLRETLSLIPGLLNFEYVQNTGIAFSIPLTGLPLKILTLILIFGIFWYYFTEEKSKKSTLLDMSYALIFAGAIGNAWERIFRGYVTDFISLEYFAVFNLADSYITLGALGIIIYYFKAEKLSTN